MGGRKVDEQARRELVPPAQARVLASVVVAFVQGAAVQSVRDPASHDPEGFLAGLALLAP